MAMSIQVVLDKYMTKTVGYIRKTVMEHKLSDTRKIN